MKTEKANPIFIGGTARSGTSILYYILSRNIDIYAFPKEMRFIVDNEGVLNLINSLTDFFSPVIAREAIFRFERLMKFYLTTPHISPYPNFDLTKYIEKEFYFSQIDEFLAKLYYSKYQGTNWQIEDFSNLDTKIIKYAKIVEKLRHKIFKRKELQFFYERQTIVMPKYFDNKEYLYRIAAEFINKLFMNPTQRNVRKFGVKKLLSIYYTLIFYGNFFPMLYLSI